MQPLKVIKEVDKETKKETKRNIIEASAKDANGYLP